MSTTVGRNLSEIEKKIKGIDTEIRKTKKEVSEFGKALKIDPTNIELINKKFKAMDKQLQISNQKTSLLNQKQSKLNDSFANGELKLSAYERLVDKTSSVVQKLDKESTQLTSELSKQNQVIAQAKYDKIIDGANKSAAAMKPFSNALLGSTVALGAGSLMAINYGSNLDDLANKYNTTSEAIQLQGNRMERATGVQDGYIKTLSSIGSIMTSVAKGSTRYDEVLQKLKLTSADLEGKTNAEVYELLLGKLQSVTDETERYAIAQGLLGDSGLNLALLASQSAEQIAAWDEKLKAMGITSNETALALANAGDKIDDVKQFLTVALGEFIGFFVEMDPALLTFLGVITSIIILLPKIIAGFAAVRASLAFITAGTFMQTVATHGLMAALTPIMPLLIGIGLIITAIIALVSVLSKKAREAAEEQEAMLKAMQEGLNGELNNQITASSESISQSNSTKTVKMDISLKASGDTPIAKNNAVNIGTALKEQLGSDINQMMGDYLKGGN